MKRLLFLFSLLLVVGTACGSGPEEAPAPAPALESPATSTPAPATPIPEPSTPTALPTDTPAAEASEPAAAEPSDEGSELLGDEAIAAPDSLESYRSIMRFSYEGVDQDGNPDSSSIEIETEYVRDSQARRMIMSGMGLAMPGDQDRVAMVEIGDTMYFQVEGEWLTISGEETPFTDTEDAALLDSGFLFSDLEGAKRVRPDESINGVDSRHYTFDEEVLSPLLGLTGEDRISAQGEVWIAKDGGYVTRYVMDVEVVEGSGGLLAPTLSQGTLHMELELQDVNSADIVIEPPVDLSAGVSLSGFEESSLPLPEGTTIVVASSQFVMAESSLTAAELQAFFEEAMAELDWTKDEDASVAFGELVNLVFTKDGSSIGIALTGEGEDGQTQILISTEEAQ